MGLVSVSDAAKRLGVHDAALLTARVEHLPESSPRN